MSTTRPKQLGRRGRFLLPTLNKGFLSAIIAAVLSLANLTFMATPARAIAVDASAASFIFNYGTNGTLLSGSSVRADGAVTKYSNITGGSISGIAIDAIVTTELTTSEIDVYDNPGGASNNTDYFQIDGDINAPGGTLGFTFEFFEAGTYTGVGTGIPITLNDVSITSVDLDGAANFCQFSDFTGFQNYFLGANSNIDVQTNATDPTIPLGTTRFMATSCRSNLNIVEDAVQVQYDSVTTFTVRFGTDRSPSANYFGIAFKPLSAVFGITQPTGNPNPSNQPPTSNDTTRSVTSNQPSIIQLEDFGEFQDPDSNPFEKVKITQLPGSGSLQKFVNGSWVAVSLNDEILVSDITNGNLRYTGSSDSSLRFKVSDGGTSYSNDAYTLTLLISEATQTISFANPGTKTPTSGQFNSNATSSSGLEVTLTSSTPGVCSVSGLTITPVSAGTCTIVASQAGNRFYSAATSVTQTFPISSLQAQTISAENPGSKTFTGTPSTFTVAPTASSNLTVSLFSLSTSVCTVSGFEITIVGAGNCTIRNSQAGNVTYATAPPVEYTFAVGTPFSGYTLSYNGNANSGGSAPANLIGEGTVTLSNNSGSLVRSGYTFVGWNTEPNGRGTRYPTSSSYELVADQTLFAEWQPLSDGLANTGGDLTPVLPVAFTLLAAGALLIPRRTGSKKH